VERQLTDSVSVCASTQLDETRTIRIDENEHTDNINVISKSDIPSAVNEIYANICKQNDDIDLAKQTSVTILTNDYEKVSMEKIKEVPNNKERQQLVDTNDDMSDEQLATMVKQHTSNDVAQLNTKFVETKRKYKVSLVAELNKVPMNASAHFGFTTDRNKVISFDSVLRNISSNAKTVIQNNKNGNESMSSSFDYQSIEQTSMTINRNVKLSEIKDNASTNEKIAAKDSNWNSDKTIVSDDDKEQVHDAKIKHNQDESITINKIHDATLVTTASMPLSDQSAFEMINSQQLNIKKMDTNSVAQIQSNDLLQPNSHDEKSLSLSKLCHRFYTKRYK
jgi:hypothetical protein